ncbi:zinc ribbon domain-containing protein [Caldimonas brevitalea]|uniref:Uncharacterized protein n=1 Tax=Caldimonas brevitalea TaxID=413882 RepID=A0A0G3BXV6_9BURK|nr:zinc ribbon domain-containing protein [Caldimonas brevitalea]AKJ32231.1 hypothetical protein AAW51_5540 [Caldimonas brevitalea]
MSISQNLRFADALLSSLEAVRNGRALVLLLGTFSVSGLLLAMTGQAFNQGKTVAGSVYGLLALVAAFYGCNAAGIVLMDDVKQAKPRRSVADALSVALRTAHRLLGVLGLIAVTYGAGALVLAVVLLICKIPLFGPVAFTFVMPVAVVVCGLALLALPTVIMPLAAPAVWDGADTLQCGTRLFAIARERLIGVVVMMLVVGLLASLVGAMVMFVVMTGGQAVARLAVAILGGETTVQQLMAGMFGFGVRSMAGAGVNVGASPYAVAALIGGGVVFAVGLVLPGLVYLRGACAVYLAHVDVALALEQPAAFRKTDAHEPPPVSPPPATARRPLRGILAPPPPPSGLDTTITMARAPYGGDRHGTPTGEVDLLLDDLPSPACPVCGHAIARDDRFCGTCGAVLRPTL